MALSGAGIVVYPLLTGYVCTVYPHMMVWVRLGMEPVELRQKWIVRYIFS